MTAQQSDILINEHPGVDLHNLELYFILRGDIHGDKDHVELPVPPEIPENNLTCSALWRGYVATFHLAADGTLELVSYDFPYARPRAPTQRVSGGKLNGDFWIRMRRFFFGPNTDIPLLGSLIRASTMSVDLNSSPLVLPPLTFFASPRN